MVKKDKSEDSHAILDIESRKRKTAKMHSVLKEFVKVRNPKVLDVGTGSGHIPHFLSEKYDDMHSVDVVDERKVKDGYEFKLVKDERLPYNDKTFDVVITNHVVEHVPNQELHIKEISRVLKDNGVVYLATPNKYWLYDPHYRLPFISWMSRSASTKYLEMTQKKEWDIYPVSVSMLKRLTKDAGLLKLVSMTPEIIKNPKKYNLDTFWLIKPIAKFLPKTVIRWLDPITPTLIYIIKK